MVRGDSERRTLPTATIFPSGCRTVAVALLGPKEKWVVCLPSLGSVGVEVPLGRPLRSPRTGRRTAEPPRGRLGSSGAFARSSSPRSLLSPCLGFYVEPTTEGAETKSRLKSRQSGGLHWAPMGTGPTSKWRWDSQWPGSGDQGGTFGIAKRNSRRSG